MSMTWKPCGNKDCEYYCEAECETETRRQHKWLKMEFGSTHNHIGVLFSGGSKCYAHPCHFCDQYRPTKMPLCTKESKNETRQTAK